MPSVTSAAVRQIDDGIGEEAVGELLADLGVGPREEASVDEEERLEREGAAIDLDHALLVLERAGLAVGDADRRPIGLLAHEPARIRAARRIGGDAPEEGLDRARELERAHLDRRDAEAAARDALRERDPQIARGGVRHVDVAPVGVGVGRRVDLGPRDAVVRGRDRETLAAALGLPIDDEAAVLALALEIDLDPFRTVVASTPPADQGRSLAEAVRGMTRARARRADERRKARCQVLRLELGDPETAPAAGSGGERELERADVGEGAATGGPPGELDLAAADADVLPRRRQSERGPAVPPDVPSARIAELELEVVARSTPAERERERIDLGERDGERLPRDDEAAALAEVEVETERLSVRPRVAHEVEAGEAGRDRQPAREIGEVVEGHDRDRVAARAATRDHKKGGAR